MATIFDYLNWRGDISFNEDPFNDVDNLVLAELAYTEFGGLVSADFDETPLSEVADGFFSTHSRLDILEDDNPVAKAPLLMDGMLSGNRFGNITLSNYVNIIDENKDMQISAVTYRLSDGTAYIAFRGTDSTIVGWKEDFNMSYLTETGGQRKAVEYLNEIGAGLDMPIRVGGHSKGGNFAVYASAFCNAEVRDKLINVYTNDGPGFRNEVKETENYKTIIPLVTSIVPDTSIIGMLLTSSSKHHVVKSFETGLAQHDGMSWLVKRNKFEPAEMSDIGTIIRKIQKDWLSKIDDKSRESFVNSLFSLFEATGMGTFGAMSDSKLKSAESIISAIQGMPRDKQKEMKQIAAKLLESSRQAVFDSIEEKLKDNI